MTNRREFLKQAGSGVLGASILMTFPYCRGSEEVINGPFVFPRNTPEQQGISSQAIRDFLQAANESELEFHSMMLLRRGHVVAEGWWEPYDKSLKHTLYSLSKSFTSTAVGMVVADGKLNVSDKVLSFFTESAPTEISDYLAKMEVRHLLTMTTGHSKGTLGGMRSADDQDWVKAFFAQDLTHEPGTHFMYNTGATYMLSAIIQKITGQTLFDFLSERLFSPLEIEGADWEVDPKGINVGGYGLRVKTEDIAKLGQLYLQKGRWKDQQLLPETWVEEATKKQTDSNEGDHDWAQGYGYQFWRCKPEPGFYRGDGAFGQYCIVIPQYETVIAITSESIDMAASMELIWKHILPAIKEVESLEIDSINSDQLVQDLENLLIPLPKGNATNSSSSVFSGKMFQLEENDWGAKSLRFNFSENTLLFTLTDDKGEHKVSCGLDRWETAKNPRLGFNDLFTNPERPSIDSHLAAHATWQDESTLLMTWRYNETAHHDSLTCQFDDDSVTISFLNSVAKGRKQEDGRADLRGEIVG